MMITEFAPAERAPMETVSRQAEAVAGQPLIQELLNAVLDYVVILNPQRQIVFASENLGKLVPGAAVADLLGKRPGEALGCVHSDATDGGCGTTAFCKECGAVRTILSSLAGKKDCQECRMMRLRNSEEEAIDVLVTATPLTINNETFSMLAMADISHEKRRRALERIFFHDVINSAGGLDGRIRLLSRRAPVELHEQIGMLRAGVLNVLDEILAQRDLVAAESDELALELLTVNSRNILEQVLQLYANHPVSEGRSLTLHPDSVSLTFTTDPRLLRRILGNLVKNALEASKPGQEVRAGCSSVADGVLFQVHNPAVIPPNVQVQIFNRSFSTKGAGRGLGTYSVKLLSERYLSGKAGFTSDEAGGTTFYVTLPLTIARGV